MDQRPDPSLFDAVLSRIAEWRAQHTGLFVLGICGAQGSGKSTLARALANHLSTEGIRTAILSLDDLYLTQAERAALASKVHPLFATRGPPGTHDIVLGLETIAALARGEAAPLPRFDKAHDERVPKADWPRAPSETQVLILEGWCLGAAPQPEATLAHPVNALEAKEDPQGVWRAAVNRALAGEYRALWTRIDRLVLLAAPGWEIVGRWREQAEAGLRDKGGAGVMSPPEIARFIQHYERLTRWVLAEMPARADLVFGLGAERQALAIIPRAPDRAP